MKTGSKVLLGISGAVLLVAGSVAGTLAYLTSRSQVVNTFTMGKVDIDLTETKVDDDGNVLTDENGVPTGERTDENDNTNNYRLVPGTKYVKDPMITVKADSEEAYIRMIVTISNWKGMSEFVTAPAELFTDLNDAVWNLETSTPSGDNLILEYRYGVTGEDGWEDVTATGTTADVNLAPLFTELTIPGAIQMEDVADLEGFEIDIIGHAIQANGFADADTAWEAFDAQEGTTEAAT